eukprot:GHVR01132338.1.p1 GENE.GHVR01132338.1~~GHVR01132338.1.p1  ORF type:complete len:168 (-),score=27.06 GHVR01132338.1:80-583(-)
MVVASACYLSSRGKSSSEKKKNSKKEKKNLDVSGRSSGRRTPASVTNEKTIDEKGDAYSAPPKRVMPEFDIPTTPYHERPDRPIPKARPAVIAAQSKKANKVTEEVVAEAEVKGVSLSQKEIKDGWQMVAPKGKKIDKKKTVEEDEASRLFGGKSRGYKGIYSELAE